MDVRIGIVQSAKEIEVEWTRTPTATACSPRSSPPWARSEGVLWLTDRKGRRVGVPVAKVAYVEVGAPDPRAPGRFRRPLTRPRRPSAP